jgi:hypothetical protein
MELRMTDIAERYCRAWNRPMPLLPRLELIPWGIDCERFAPRPALPARLDLNLPTDRTILLCLGRIQIHDKMDWTPLLLAFQRLRQMSDEPLLFVLAGSGGGDYPQTIVSQARELGLGGDLRTFFGVAPACLASLYAACDIFVSPVDTPSESFGLTIVEAMACGRTVVASDWDGYKDIIIHGETGFRVRTDWADCFRTLNRMAPLISWDQEHLHVGQSVSIDVGQMAQFLGELVRNRELRQEMGLRARARIESFYDWRSIIPRWEAMWAELSAIAATITEPPPDHLDYLQPNFAEHFAHYPSRLIDDSVLVSLTDRGRSVLSEKAPLFLHPLAQSFLKPEHLRATLAALSPGRWLGTGLTTGDVVGLLKKAQGLDRDEALMHLMWLAKYDLVALAE